LPGSAADWQTRFYHSDHIGSVRRLTNEAGQVTDGYTYSAFGERIAHTGTDPQPYAFTGEPYDANLGFEYNRARWMDPRVGRFLGMDPLAADRFDPPTLHRYLYVRDDPVNLLDPSGLREGGLVSLTMALSFMMTLAAIHLPRLTSVLYAVAEVFSPVELGLTPGQIGLGKLRRAAKQGGHQILERLANTWRLWRARGGTRATGLAFEDFIGSLLRPGARHHVGIEDGIETGKKTGKAIADWVDDTAEQVVESKNSFASVHYEQALELGHYAAKNGYAVHYVFLKRPTATELDDLSGWLEEGAQRAQLTVEIRFSYLEP
jgi:RHS repeat-associated protein